MNLREFVIKEYQATVRNSPNLSKELKDALKINERVPAFMDNLCRELAHPAFKNKSNNYLKDVVHNATNFFIALVKQKAEERMMSDIKKMQIKQDIQDKQTLDKACDTGEINEEVLDAISRQKEKIISETGST